MNAAFHTLKSPAFPQIATMGEAEFASHVEFIGLNGDGTFECVILAGAISLGWTDDELYNPRFDALTQRVVNIAFLRAIDVRKRERQSAAELSAFLARHRPTLNQSHP